jgi:hypothetical protein
MPRKRINVSFPEPVLELLGAMVPPRERNAFIVGATEQALRRERLRKVIEALREKPAWSDEGHPDLMTAEDVDRYVRRLRETWMPRSWDEIVQEAGGRAHTCSIATSSSWRSVVSPPRWTCWTDSGLAMRHRSLS